MYIMIIIYRKYNYFHKSLSCDLRFYLFLYFFLIYKSNKFVLYGNSYLTLFLHIYKIFYVYMITIKAFGAIREVSFINATNTIHSWLTSYALFGPNLENLPFISHSHLIFNIPRCIYNSLCMFLYLLLRYQSGAILAAIIANF